MSLRSKYAAITIVALIVGVAAIWLISILPFHGYALLPFVVVAGLSLYIAFAAFFNILFPQKDLVEDQLSYLLLELAFGRFFH